MYISIILPSFKPENYIFECLASIQQQTINKDWFEVIIILNGCNEPYKSRIEEYVSFKMKGVKVKLIQTNEAGVSNARNIGLDKSQGKYITFIDDDDFISANYLESMWKIAQKGYFPVSNLKTYTESTGAIGEDYISHVFNKYKNNNRRDILSLRSFFSVPVGKLISNEIIKNRRFNTKFEIGEDSLFMTLISDEIKLIKLTEEDCIYYRRIRENSASRKKRTKKEKIIIYNKLIGEYILIYLKSPFKQSLIFILTRILASIQHVLRK